MVSGLVRYCPKIRLVGGGEHSLFEIIQQLDSLNDDQA